MVKVRLKFRDKKEKSEKKSAFPFLPHEIVRDAIIISILLSALLFLSSIVPPPLHEVADPYNTPKFLLPDWYFLWVYGMLKIAPPLKIMGREILNAETIGVLMPLAFFIILFLLPFIDRGKASRPATQPKQAALGVATIILMLALAAFSLWEVFGEAFPIISRESWKFILKITVLFLPFLTFGLAYLGITGMRKGYAWLLNQCYECFKCDLTCPVNKVYDLPDLNLVYNVYKKNPPDYLWECLTCARCTEACPLDIGYYEFIRNSRQDKRCEIIAHRGILTDLAEIESLMDKPNKIVNNGSKYGYYPGCVDNLYLMEIDGVEYDEISKSSLKLLKNSGIDASRLNLKCCGHDVLWQGNVDVFERLKKYNTEKIRESGIETLIVSCAECYRTFKKDYDLNVKVVHISDFLRDKNLYFKLNNQNEGKNVAYHDPCRLGRHMGMYDEPRDLIRRVKGVNLVELENSRENALCCGISAMMGCDDRTKALRAYRMNQAKYKRIDYLLTTCPKCVTHFQCLKNEENDYNFKIMDLTTFMAQNLEENGGIE